MEVQNSKVDFKIPNPPAEFRFLHKKSMQQILNIELEATVKSLEEKKRAIAKIKMEKLDEKNLGQLLQFWMLEVYFLGKILGVNPFDQPGVERGKILTKKILKKDKC